MLHAEVKKSSITIQEPRIHGKPERKEEKKRKRGRSLYRWAFAPVLAWAAKNTGKARPSPAEAARFPNSARKTIMNAWLIVTFLIVHGVSNTSIVPAKSCDLKANIWCMACSDKKELLAIGITKGERNVIKLLPMSLQGGFDLAVTDHSTTDLSFSANGLYVISASKVLHLWNTEQKALVATNDSYAVRATFVRGSLIGGGVSGESPRLFQLTNRAKEFQEQKVLYGQYCSCWAFSFNGNLLATGYGYLVKWKDEKPGQVKVWHVNTGELIANLKTAEGEIVALELSEDGKLIIVGTTKGFAVWDIMAKKCLVNINADAKGDIVTATFIPGTDFIVGGSSDGALRLVNVNAPNKPFRLVFHNSPVRGLVYSKRTASLISCEEAGRVAVWSLKEIKASIDKK
jgi:WD40 repeat protein